MGQTLLERASFSEAFITRRLQETALLRADSDPVLQDSAG